MRTQEMQIREVKIIKDIDRFDDIEEEINEFILKVRNDYNRFWWVEENMDYGEGHDENFDPIIDIKINDNMVLIQYYIWIDWIKIDDRKERLQWKTEIHLKKIWNIF